jgi:hypothetical protein
MSWFLAGKILVAITATIAVVTVWVALFLRWKFRGVLHWNSSLKEERNILEKELEASENEARTEALQFVLNRYEEIYKTNSPSITEVTQVVDFVKDIARCYHPDAEKPEYCITVGSLLQCSGDVVERIQEILTRPGFSRLRKIRVRDVLNARERVQKLQQSPIVQKMVKAWKPVSRVLSVRFLFFPDPLSILTFLSNRLTVLIATRSLLLDIYLFVGKLAIRAYDQGELDHLSPNDQEIEQVLEGLDEMDDYKPHLEDARILELRKQLPGLDTLLKSDQLMDAWKSAVLDAANHIAQKHFPNAEKPLLEARIGPLLLRSQHWLQVIGETSKYPVVRKLHKLQINSVLDSKSMMDTWIPKPVRKFMNKSAKLYGKLKWPLKVFRWAKKFHPQKMALEVGIHVTYMSLVGLACRRSFDTVCSQLEQVYGSSVDSEK